jgi:hypothetical protein
MHFSCHISWLDPSGNVQTFEHTLECSNLKDSHKLALFWNCGPAIMCKRAFYIQMCPQNGYWLGRFWRIWVWISGNSKFKIFKFCPPLNKVAQQACGTTLINDLIHFTLNEGIGITDSPTCIWCAKKPLLQVGWEIPRSIRWWQHKQCSKDWDINPVQLVKNFQNYTNYHLDILNASGLNTHVCG